MDSLTKNLIRIGQVSSIDAAKCTVKVVFPDKSQVVSHDLPILVRGSKDAKDYWMPRFGEQVVCLFLPNGNARGFVIGSLYSDDVSPPVVDSNKRNVTFSDGTSIEYDTSTSTLLINAAGPIKITGDITVTGSITASGDVKSGSISLSSHEHSGVTAGTSNTGPPV